MTADNLTDEVAAAASNVSEQAVSGTSWRRAYQVAIDNQYGEAPRVHFYQEDIVALDSGAILRQAAPSLSVEFDSATVVELLDPETGAATGAQMTLGQLQAGLYSYYVALAARG